jgi:RNA polymerase sigma-70 factor, ECF subfamily
MAEAALSTAELPAVHRFIPPPADSDAPPPRTTHERDETSGERPIAARRPDTRAADSDPRQERDLLTESRQERDLLAESRASEAPGAPISRTPASDARLRMLVQDHFDFIWRSLRRLGVPHTDVDDCAQQVFWVAARKLALISEGSERAFLFSTALRVASDARRSRVRRREVPQEEETRETHDTGPRPDEIADQKRARALLDEVLAQMTLDLRTVFVLFELEELTTQEIAALLDLPTGTVASRLRRAREEFQKLVRRLQARASHEGQVAQRSVSAARNRHLSSRPPASTSANSAIAASTSAKSAVAASIRGGKS